MFFGRKLLVFGLLTILLTSGGVASPVDSSTKTKESDKQSSTIDAQAKPQTLSSSTTLVSNSSSHPDAQIEPNQLEDINRMRESRINAVSLAKQVTELMPHLRVYLNCVRERAPDCKDKLVRSLIDDGEPAFEDRPIQERFMRHENDERLPHADNPGPPPPPPDHDRFHEEVPPYHLIAPRQRRRYQLDEPDHDWPQLPILERRAPPFEYDERLPGPMGPHEGEPHHFPPHHEESHHEESKHGLPHHEEPPHQEPKHGLSHHEEAHHEPQHHEEEHREMEHHEREDRGFPGDDRPHMPPHHFHDRPLSAFANGDFGSIVNLDNIEKNGMAQLSVLQGLHNFMWDSVKPNPATSSKRRHPRKYETKVKRSTKVSHTVVRRSVPKLNKSS